MTNITDGLASTIMVVEGGACQGPYNYSLNPVAVSSTVPYSGSDWQEAEWIGAANWNSINNGALRYLARYEWWGRINAAYPYAPSSGHPGGIHVLAGDGAVHYVSDKMNPGTFISLSTCRKVPAVGMAIADGSYGPGYVTDWMIVGVNLRENQDTFQE